MADDSTQEQQATRSTGSRFSFRQIVGVIVLIAFVVFLVANNHQVKVRFLVTDRSISLSFALLIAGVLGAVGLLLVQHRRRRG